MTTVEMLIQSETDTDTDVGKLWKAAIERYEEITTVNIKSLAAASNVDEILVEIHERDTKLKDHRHDGSKLDKFRTLVSRSLDPIDRLSDVVGSAASSSFPPSTAIFKAVSYLIKTAKSVSADYDKIAGFFEDLDLYLHRLKILEKHVPSIPTLEVALVEVLTSVLVLCGISLKYIKKNRLAKGLRNLVSGEDDELTTAYKHFHKMVEQEQAAVNYASLAAAEQLKKDFAAIHSDVRRSVVMTKRTDQNTKILVASTENMERRLESREAALERDDILSRLSSLNFDKKQRDVFAKHHQGTGQWLLDTVEFQQWVKGGKNSTLLCPGIRTLALHNPRATYPDPLANFCKAGAGKTVMTSFAVNYVQEATRGRKVAIVYVYCSYQNPKTQSEYEILSSITRQLVEQLNFMPLAVKEFCDRNAERKRDPSDYERIALLKSICLLFETTYVFVDALDECPETNRENLLYLLKKIEPFIRLLITSRLHVDLHARFENASRIEILARVSDIAAFLESKINSSYRLSLAIAKDSHLKEDIIKVVNKKVAGMFLLASFQMDQLCRQNNLKSIRKTMNALPTELYEFYGEAMKRIADQPEEDSHLAKRAISYIFCARRPLNIEELLHALAVEDNDTALDETALPEVEILLSISAGLIRIDDQSSTVGLVHYSLQEYLEKNLENLLPEPDVEIARICLTYLSFDVFRSGSCGDGEALYQRLQEYKFLDYAACNWGYHVMKNQIPKWIDLLFLLLDDKQKLSSCVQVLHITSNRKGDWQNHFPRRFGALHVVAYWGLDEIMAILFETRINVNSQDSYGATALELAARRGHEAVVQLLLKNRAKVNLKNQNGDTALYWAVRNGHSTIVKLLLVNEASVMTKDNDGWTPLDWAVISGNNEMVKELLEYGTDMDTEDDGRQKALYWAAEEGHELTVQVLLDSGADVNAQDSRGSSALDWAAPSGHEKTIQVLLRNGADVKSRDMYENTVLHWAVPYDAIVRLLLANGADANAKNNCGQTALCWASQDGSLAVADVLLEYGTDVNAQDSCGFTALHGAALRGREAMVRLLLENGANPNAKDKDLWTPLHVTALKRHDSLVQVLLDKVDNGRAVLDWVSSQLHDTRKRAMLEEIAEEKAEASTVLTGLRSAIQEEQVGRMQVLLQKGADVNAKDIGGWTALTVAASYGYTETVRLLLEKGADVNKIGRSGRPPLLWASECGSQTVVELLVENGADVDASTYGWTAMLLASKNNYMTIAHFLIENGANVNAEDCRGRTALHWAVKHGSRSMMRLLIDNGADFNAADCLGGTVLIWAVENWQKTMVKVLVDIGAQIEARTRHHLTALHIATFMEFESAVDHLLEGGASVTATTQDNLTALHIAAFNGYESIVQQLLEKGADVDAEARWCGAEDEEEDENGVVYAAEKSLSDFLRQWFLKQGLTTVNAEARSGLTVRQLAAGGGHADVEQLL